MQPQWHQLWQVSSIYSMHMLFVSTFRDSLFRAYKVDFFYKRVCDKKMYSVIILYGHSARTTCEHLNYVLSVFVIMWLHCTAQIYATCAWLHTVYCIAIKFSTMVSLYLFTDAHTHAQYNMLYNQAWVKFPWLGQTQTQSLKTMKTVPIDIMVICVHVTSGWLYINEIQGWTN